MQIQSTLSDAGHYMNGRGGVRAQKNTHKLALTRSYIWLMDSIAFQWVFADCFFISEIFGSD